MISNKPYLIRAFFEWIVDSDCTPVLVVDAHHPRASVPVDFVENGEICLNISPDAVRDLKLGNDVIEFRASFSGIVHLISAPVSAVLAIYAQENNQGMFFEYDEEESGISDQTPKTQEIRNVDNKKRPSHLKLVE